MTVILWLNFVCLILLLIVVLWGFKYRQTEKWRDLSQEQYENFKHYQIDNLKLFNNHVQQEITGVRQQLFDLLNGYVTQIAGKMDLFNRQVELRFGEITKEVNQQLSQGYEKNQNLFGEVIKRLSLIDHTQEQLGNLGGQIQGLQDILSDKRARGAFGETQLHLLLQETMAESQYQLQYTLSNGTRVDCFLKLPNAMGNIAIDSKFPLESYRKKYAPALSEKERLIFENQFKLDIKKHIQDIAEKYIIPGETAEGAIMFLPAESVFAEIHNHFPELVSLAYQKKVWMVSPATLMALLLTVSALIKDAKTYQHAEQIKIQLASLSKEFVRFQERIENFAKHYRLAEEGLNQILLTTNKIVKHFQQIVNSEK